MNFTYETQENATYLVYSITEKDVLDTVSLGMLMNNKIPGLAPTFFTQRDAQKYLRYNISSKIPAQQFFSGVVNRKKLVGVFSGIIDAFLSIDEYMIDMNTMMLDLEYIYTDVSTYETMLVCLPIERETRNDNMASFFKNIVFGTKFDETENCEYVAKLLTYFNSSSNFSLLEFKKVLDEISGKSVNTSAPKVNAVSAQTNSMTAKETSAPSGQNEASVQPVAPVGNVNSPNSNVVSSATVNRADSQSIASVEVPEIPAKETKKSGMFGGFLHKTLKEEKPRKEKKKGVVEMNVNVATSGKQSFDIPGMNNSISTQPSAKPMTMTQVASTPQGGGVKDVSQSTQNSVSSSIGFGETTVLSVPQNIGETTVLSAVTAMPFLLRVKNNERIILEKPVFRIGKERSFVDYFISDNPAISRSHANIISKNGACFVVDTNSTNHTYVNGEMIQSNVEVQLTQGDKIRLANEEFEFRVY